MTSAGESPTSARPQPFQFGMAAGLTVVTGLCIVLSLCAWHPVFGGMLSALIVGSWWSYAAWRAGRRGLAYYLAAWPMGVVAFVVGLTPWMWEVLLYDPWDSGKDLALLGIMVVMWFAAIVTVGLLRRVIRRPGAGALARAGVFAVYTTAALFMLLAPSFVAIGFVATGQERLVDVLAASPMLLAGVVASAIWATLLMPVAWPIGIFFCAILRRIDPAEPVLGNLDRSILQIVDAWQADEAGRLGLVQVAQRLGIAPERAFESLESLRGLGVLDWTDRHGYCRKGAVSHRDAAASPAEPGRTRASTTRSG